MSKKKKNILIVVILLILTNTLTFSVANIINVKTNKSVVMSKDNYDKLMTTYENNSKAEVLKDYIKKNYLREIDDKSLEEGKLSGIFQALDDPYSAYLTEEDFKEFKEHTNGVYGGIGVIVSPGKDNLITVVSPIKGTPGEKAGLRTGDKILKVNGKEFPADKMDQAVKNMKGKAGTEVVLSIMRKDGDKNEFFDKKIKRENIKLETVHSKVIEGNLGYISISSFDKETHNEFKEALEKMEEKKVKGLVLDLRNNPGGLLNVCVDIADEFLDEGTVVYTETRNKERAYEKSKNGKTELPTVVLVNKGSASASEILSGALQDRKRAKIIGETTFGKGVVQGIKELNDGTGFKLTESEYFTPSGRSIDGVGVKPDIEVKLPKDVRIIGIENLKDDTQLKKAIKVLKDDL